ncbi:MAG: hypothetical protein JKY27_00215 [Magnetovibrio sp.]|nr:hypothetical protein [Magnetovibrio sp.]
MSKGRDMSMYYKMGRKQVAKRTTIDDENNKYFEGWSVHKINDKYQVQYTAAAHGGGVVKFDVTEYEYRKAHSGILTLSDLLRIYPEHGVIS